MKSSLEKTMLDIARKAIMERHTGEEMINCNELMEQYPELAEPGAVFVTLNKNGQLRGCIGSIKANRQLIDDIIHNARAAAFSDSRFLPVNAGEIDDLTIEISLLSPGEKVEYKTVEELKSILVPGKDGIILAKGFNTAVFLPQVWEKIPDFDRFFYYLCTKAGLPGDCLWHHPDIYRFRVSIIEEEQ